MKSKISFFNRTIYKKNLVLFWPIWGSFLLFELFQGPLYLWFHFGKNTENRLEVLLGSIDAQVNILAVALASLIIGMALFNYLFSSKSANMIHALPLTRSELYGTNLISGLTFLLLPELLSFFFSVLVCLANGVAEVQYLGMWFLASAGMSFFFFSLVTFCAMLTGQLFALPAYFVICNILVEGITFGVTWLVSRMAYGVNAASFRAGVFRCLSPLLYLLDEVKIIGSYNILNDRNSYELTEIQMYGSGKVLCYAVVAVFIYMLAYYAYRRRQIESAGNLLTFSWIKPLFRWGVGVCFGFLGGTAGMYFLQEAEERPPIWVWLILVLICGAIAFFLAEMLIQKAFAVISVKRSKECGLFACFTALTFAGVYGYAYNVAHYIPQADEVEYAYVDMNYPVEFQGENIAQVLDLQREILTKQPLLEEELEANEVDNGYGYVTLTYRLKDGKILTRGYTLPSGADVSRKMLGSIYAWEEEPQSFLRQYIEYDYESISRITDAEVEWYDSEDMNYVFRNVEGEGARALFDAVIADAEDGVLQKYNHIDYGKAWPDRVSEEYAVLYIYFYHGSDSWQTMYDRVNGMSETNSYVIEGELDGYPDNPAADARGGIYLTFGEDCTHILQTLLDIGMIESYGDIEYISDDAY